MIWHRRFVLKRPQEEWTDDPILQKYKFTNVYRELDRGTQFLWGSVWHQKKLENILFPVVVYRFINRPEFFEWLGTSALDIDESSDIDSLCEHCVAYQKETGLPLFNTAYRVICNTPAGDTRVQELGRLLKEFQAHYDCIIDKIMAANSLQDLCTVLQEIKHVGPFLAYEIAMDLINLVPVLSKRFDEDEWANVGPGAFIGLANIYPFQKEEWTRENQSMGLQACKMLRNNQKTFLPKEFPYYNGKPLSLRNIEHSLCEYGKYCNIRDGKGRARPLFHPTIHA